jgi:hypothetical protein
MVEASTGCGKEPGSFVEVSSFVAASFVGIAGEPLSAGGVTFVSLDGDQKQTGQLPQAGFVRGLLDELRSALDAHGDEEFFTSFVVCRTDDLQVPVRFSHSQTRSAGGFLVRVVLRRLRCDRLSHWRAQG